MLTETDNFRYVSSFDELTWHIDGNNKVLGNRCLIPWSARPEVRDWIQTSCGSTVYCWNGTSKPAQGSTNWASILSPDDERCYLIFTDPGDNELFLLRFADRFSVKHLDLVAKLLHDSRTI